MKKVIGIIFLCITISFPLFALAQVPFGGMVVSTLPCNTGLLLYVQTTSGTKPFLWNFGELPYLMHTPPHVGQNLLGEAAPAAEPCILGFYPYAIFLGVGLPIEFHGSSL